MQAGRSAWSPVCEAVTAATVPSPPPPPNMLGSSQCSASITWKAGPASAPSRAVPARSVLRAVHVIGSRCAAV